MKDTDLTALRVGAEIGGMKPYIDVEVASLQKAVVNSVLSAMNAGELTPDMAQQKWVEYLSYTKLSQKFEQRMAVGKAVSVDFPSKLV